MHASSHPVHPARRCRRRHRRHRCRRRRRRRCCCSCYSRCSCCSCPYYHSYRSPSFESTRWLSDLPQRSLGPLRWTMMTKILKKMQRKMKMWATRGRRRRRRMRRMATTARKKSSVFSVSFASFASVSFASAAPAAVAAGPPFRGHQSLILPFSDMFGYCARFACSARIVLVCKRTSCFDHRPCPPLRCLLLLLCHFHQNQRHLLRPPRPPHHHSHRHLLPPHCRCHYPHSGAAASTEAASHPPRGRSSLLPVQRLHPRTR